MTTLDEISWKGKTLAYILKADKFPDKTTFFSKSEANLQVGCVVYGDNSEIPKHLHKPVKRNLDRTEEVLILREGKCILDIYNNNKEKVTSRNLSSGDVIILVAGGHGFRVTKKTVLLEIKQGPYFGVEEKERF